MYVPRAGSRMLRSFRLHALPVVLVPLSALPSYICEPRSLRTHWTPIMQLDGLAVVFMF